MGSLAADCIPHSSVQRASIIVLENLNTKGAAKSIVDSMVSVAQKASSAADQAKDIRIECMQVLQLKGANQQRSSGRSRIQHFQAFQNF